MKSCNRCGETKPLDEFARDASKRSGYRGRCLACQRSYWNEWRSNNGGVHRETVKRWRERNPDKVRDAGYRRNYGLTLEQVNELAQQQGDACSICRRTGLKLVVDHNHETGQVRALLCAPCNKGLGMFEEDTARLADAIEYLRRNYGS